MKKKGVSPIIGTVILVMIVVAIGAGIMTVIRTLANDNLQSVEREGKHLQCGTDVKVALYSVNDVARICLQSPTSTRDGALALFLENKGVKPIDSWQLTVVGDGINSSIIRTTALGVSGNTIQGFNFTFGGVGESRDDVQAIILRPRVPGSGGGTYVTCEDSTLEWHESAISDWYECDAATTPWITSI